jgi:hypothetical protein
MRCASITFEGEIDKQKCEITLDVSADYRQPISAATMREILVQAAIRLTNPDELERLSAELATPGTAPKAAAAGAAASAALAPPLLRPKLALLKKNPLKT